jgi:ABC-type lipoprotein release transport system permease subunit
LDLKLRNNNKLNIVKKQLQKSLGENFLVENRAEQQKDYFKIIKIERFLVFLILAFILFIAICNIISSLSMLLIEKKNDIAAFRNLGAGKKMLQRIFVIEGWLMSIIGSISGILLGLLICLVQQKFGFLKMETGAYFENYPVSIKFLDVFIVLVTVLIIGFFTVLYPVKYFLKKEN